MRQLSLAIGSVILLGLGGLLLGTRVGSASDLPHPAAPVTAEVACVHAATVNRGPVSHPILATGLLRDKSQIDLGFLLGGEVSYVGVDVGQRVNRGQLLARINSTQVAAEANRARAAALQATREWQRVDTLQRSGALPQAALDSAQTGHLVALAQQQSAEFALNHSVLVAPDDGVIQARLVDRGELVAPGQPVLRMSGQSRGAVIQVHLTDRDVVGLELNRPAAVRIDALGETKFAAKVTEIAPVATLGSGTFDVELRMDAPPTECKSGMTAKATIDRQVAVGCSIPVSALVPGDTQGAAVVAIDHGVARRIPVTVLFFEGDRAALKETLADVQRVATEGATTVASGSLVKVVEP